MRTTSIRLQGDYYAAKVLADSHVNRLLEIFRKNSSFQNLSVNSAKTHFYGEHGEWLGTIDLFTSFGTEIITVTAKPGVAKPQEQKWLEEDKFVTVELFVPIIRSDDNKYFIACLSGTFEGPYYTFENTNNYPDETFDDNIEKDLNNVILDSKSGPFQDGFDPQLLFISQTGIKPDNIDYEYSGGQTIEYTPRGDYEAFVGIPDEYEVEYECPTDYIDTVVLDDYKCARAVDTRYGSFTGEPYTTKYIVLDKEILPRGEDKYILVDITKQGLVGWSGSSVVDFWGGFIIPNCQFINEEVPAYNEWAIDHVKDEVSNRYESSMQGYTIYPYIDEIGFNSLITEEYTFYESFTDEDSVRIEKDNTDNFCCGYRKVVEYQSTTSSREFIPCEVEYSEIISDVVHTITYADYFRVGNTDFLLNGPVSTYYPNYYSSDNMMKYYNTNSLVRITGIACVMGVGQYSCEEIKYLYVGPNNNNQLTVTSFTPYNGQYKHIIPSVGGIDDTVYFSGRIFMSMIRYKVKVNTQQSIQG